jgi:NAD dependent epimerase/dehydratase family enzyme
MKDRPHRSLRFIGRALTERLRKTGHVIQPVSLRAPLTPDALAGCDAVVHLAGEPVAQRWTSDARERIRKSRVEGTRALGDAMRARPPQVLISASAVGYYGSRGDAILTETYPARRRLSGPARGCLGTGGAGRRDR